MSPLVWLALGLAWLIDTLFQRRCGQPAAPGQQHCTQREQECVDQSLAHHTWFLRYVHRHTERT